MPDPESNLVNKSQAPAPVVSARFLSQRGYMSLLFIIFIIFIDETHMICSRIKL